MQQQVAQASRAVTSHLVINAKRVVGAQLKAALAHNLDKILCRIASIKLRERKKKKKRKISKKGKEQKHRAQKQLSLT